jgi:hypothetical protein
MRLRMQKAQLPSDMLIEAINIRAAVTYVG